MTFVHPFLCAAYNYTIIHKDRAHKNAHKLSISLTKDELSTWRKMHIELGMEFYNYIISHLFLFLVLRTLLDNQNSIYLSGIWYQIHFILFSQVMALSHYDPNKCSWHCPNWNTSAEMMSRVKGWSCLEVQLKDDESTVSIFWHAITFCQSDQDSQVSLRIQTEIQMV